MATGATLSKLKEFLKHNDYGKKERNTSPEETPFADGIPLWQRKR
jgi:hypothetical protein